MANHNYKMHSTTNSILSIKILIYPKSESNAEKPQLIN